MCFIYYEKLAHTWKFLHFERKKIWLHRNQVGRYLKFQNLRVHTSVLYLWGWITLLLGQWVTISRSKVFEGRSFPQLVIKTVLWIKRLAKQRKVFLTKKSSSSFRLWYWFSLAPSTTGTSLTFLASLESNSVIRDETYLCSLPICSLSLDRRTMNTLSVKPSESSLVASIRECFQRKV